MKCTISEELLLSYSLNELTENEKTIVEKHLVDCEYCRSLLEEVEDLKKAWDEVSPENISENFVDQVMAQINLEETVLNLTPTATVEDSIPPKLTKPIRKMNKKQSVMNVFVALAASFVLIFTGVFSSMDQHVAQASNAFTISTQQIQQISGESFTWMNQWRKQLNSVMDIFDFKKIGKKGTE